MNELQGKKTLDMGCGSGIAGLMAASKGANCTSVDINPESVKCTEENFLINGYKAKTYESNLFENLDNTNKFDIIFFNPPYYEYEPKNDFERGFGGGKDYRVIRDFVKKAGNFLNESGYLCLIVSSDMKIEKMFSILNENGFFYNILQKTSTFFETFYIIKAFVNVT